MNKDYEIECIAMSVVNYTNEINGTSTDIRQKNNDKCFDFAIKKIKELINKEKLNNRGGYMTKSDYEKLKNNLIGNLVSKRETIDLLRLMFNYKINLKDNVISIYTGMMSLVLYVEYEYHVDNSIDWIRVKDVYLK